MRISDAGLRLIKATEGYHKKQDDGSCKAYLCPAGVWTCGWGCTDGVTPNTHWTVDEATEALRDAMRKHEADVDGLVRVPLSQGQFDALVSLCYNIGPGNLGASTLLKHLNAGDYARAASHFADFKYAKVKGSTALYYKVPNGTSVVLPGLVSRRAAEAALFLEAAPVETMPQKVEPEKAKVELSKVVKKAAPLAAAGGAVAGEATKTGVNSAAPDLSWALAWQKGADQTAAIVKWAAVNWYWAAGACAAFYFLGYVLPKWSAKR